MDTELMFSPLDQPLDVVPFVRGFVRLSTGTVTPFRFDPSPGGGAAVSTTINVIPGRPYLLDKLYRPFGSMGLHTRRHPIVTCSFYPGLAQPPFPQVLMYGRRAGAPHLPTGGWPWVDSDGTNYIVNAALKVSGSGMTLTVRFVYADHVFDLLGGPARSEPYTDWVEEIPFDFNADTADPSAAGTDPDITRVSGYMPNQQPQDGGVLDLSSDGSRVLLGPGSGTLAVAVAVDIGSRRYQVHDTRASFETTYEDSWPDELPGVDLTVDNYTGWEAVDAPEYESPYFVRYFTYASVSADVAGTSGRVSSVYTRFITHSVLAARLDSGLSITTTDLQADIEASAACEIRSLSGSGSLDYQCLTPIWNVAAFPIPVPWSAYAVNIVGGEGVGSAEASSSGFIRADMEAVNNAEYTGVVRVTGNGVNLTRDVSGSTTAEYTYEWRFDELHYAPDSITESNHVYLVDPEYLSGYGQYKNIRYTADSTGSTDGGASSETTSPQRSADIDGSVPAGIRLTPDDVSVAANLYAMGNSGVGGSMRAGASGSGPSGFVDFGVRVNSRGNVILLGESTVTSGVSLYEINEDAEGGVEDVAEESFSGAATTTAIATGESYTKKVGESETIYPTIRVLDPGGDFLPVVTEPTNGPDDEEIIGYTGYVHQCELYPGTPGCAGYDGSLTWGYPEEDPDPE